MSFWRRISVNRAVKDFAQEWQQPNQHRWLIMGVSIAATFSLMMVFIPKTERAPPARPQVTYITSFAPDRTDEEILASNIANQQWQDERRAEQERRIERRKELYRALGRATGLDVDAMEAQIAREEAAEAAESAAKAAGSSPQSSQSQAPTAEN